jgi:hypothetical protein
VSDDWTEDFEVGNCDHCTRTNVRVRLLPDPYLEELYPEDEHELSLWCYPSWTDRKDDV